MNDIDLNIDIKNFGFDPTYLRPPSWFIDIKHSKEYISGGEGKTAKRKIYYGVEFTEFEKNGIK